jgi:ankyrin repeat protein
LLKEVVVSPEPHAFRSLPAQPNLEQQKKQARELLRSVQSGEPAALQRMRAHHPRWAGRSDAEIERAALALHDAQLVLARESGFSNWAALKHHIESRRAMRQTRVFVTDLSYYDDRAAGLVSAHAARVPQALAQIREWHPAFATASDEEICRTAFDIEAARLVYARQHGCTTWTELQAYVAAIAKGERQEPFKEAFDAIRGQNWPRLMQLVEQNPEITRARGTNGNTLLNLAVSLAGRTCDPLPPQAWRLLDVFLRAGADLNEQNDRGWTALHQAAYANQVELARRLIEAGAALDREAHGEGGTPLAIALFWGHREAADLLAEYAILPRNLRVAAGLGRVDLIDECFTPDGALTAAARSGRGFYRPHSGFPVWMPSDNRQEILDEALVWAGKADRVNVLPLLVAYGADVNADPYRGTPLIWASAKNRLAAAQWLLDHGAQIRRATFGGPSHGEGVTALHLAAQSNHVEMARLLLAHGADPSIEDEIYHSSARGWAEHFGSKAVLEVFEGKT